MYVVVNYQHFVVNNRLLWSIISLLWSNIPFCGQIYLALDRVSPWRPALGPAALGLASPGARLPWFPRLTL